MKIEFTKMHGIGNDYIYVNCMKRELPDPSGAAVAMSPRHFSVGADGLVMICSSSKADARMRMFNADGSGTYVRKRNPLRGKIPVRQRYIKKETAFC